MKGATVLKFLLGFAVLVGFDWLGEFLKTQLHLPLPGVVVGMLALLIALLIYGSVPAAVERASQPLLQHMSLLFIAPGVSLFFLAPEIFAQWPAIIAAIIISTAVTLAVTGLLMQRLFNKTG